MKIAFLTTCLEPGRDGVGDYTAALAEECERLGHECALVAVNDPFAEAGSWHRHPADAEDQTAEAHSTSLPTSQRGHPPTPRLSLRSRRSARDDRAGRGGGDILRLGSGGQWCERISRARDFLRDFAPDVVSLQFVCYGFHPRGLCWSAADRLREIIGTRPVQLMFHELWIGAEKNLPWKDRVIGAMQRACVLRLFQRLNIRAVHTTNPAYAAVLRGRGVNAEVLPLFGSVPPSRQPARMERGASWRFLMFGTLHPVWPPEPLFTHLRALGVPVEVWHAGHIGGGAELWERMARENAGALTFRKLGPQTPEQLAEIFADVDFGIATTPWEIIGKSASVAAMLEHGLPVVVNRDDVHYAGWREEGYDPQLIKMGPDILERLRSARRLPFASRRAQAASRLLPMLEKMRR